MQIISISGLDGSGKSTQIELLKKHLESQGKKVFYFHAVQFGLANKILSAELSSGIATSPEAPRNDSRKSVTKANWLQIMLRRFFLMIDIFRFSLLRSKGFDYILSDRYFYDSVINIKYLAKSESKLPCEKFIAKPELAIYLDADPAAIMQRERKPDQGLEYLQEKKRLYDQAAVAWGLKIIDGNRSKEEIFEEIRSLL